MKKSPTLITAAAAAAMMVAPAAATERYSAPIADQSELGGFSGERPIVYAIALGVAAAAVLIAMEILENDDDDDETVSV